MRERKTLAVNLRKRFALSNLHDIFFCFVLTLTNLHKLFYFYNFRLTQSDSDHELVFNLCLSLSSSCGDAIIKAPACGIKSDRSTEMIALTS